jgi:hypothetical protein
MANYNLYAGGGNPFAGPTTSWLGQARGVKNPYEIGQDTSTDAFALREQDQGVPALSFYASQPGVTTPFSDWLMAPSNRNRLYGDYLGAASSRPGLFFQDWLAENDPHLRWMNQSAQDRGENPQSAYALPMHFNPGR